MVSTSGTQGTASAQANLGVMYEYEQGVAQDYAEAVKWYRLAGAQGNAPAQFNLGVMYANGLGVAKDLNEAQRLLKLAADQNVEAAAEALADVQRQLAQARAPEQAQTKTVAGLSEQAQAYQGREKSLLEQILNYTSYASENGMFEKTGWGYWISGENGADKCVLTLHTSPSSPDFSQLLLHRLDLRQLDQNGFSFNHKESSGMGWWIVGDEHTTLIGDERAVLERLQKAWGLAFQECPGKKSAF